MKENEFNKVRVGNESRTYGSEYGKTSNVEFGKIRPNEFSRYNGETHYAKDEANHQETKNDYVSKNTGLRTRKTSQQTGNSAPLKTASTASSVASGVHTAIVAVTALTVTAVSSAVGFSVLSTNDAFCKFHSFELNSNSLSYSLLLKNTNEEQYEIRVENPNYSSKRELFEGENEGFFEGFTMGETYNLVIAEKKFGGKKIYDEQFVPMMTSKVYGLKWDMTANFVEQTFEVALRYSDEYNIFTDFSLSFAPFDFEKEPIVYPLEKTDEVQVFSTEELGDLEINEYTYTLKYKENGEERIGEEGIVRFADNSSAVSRLYPVKWDHTANYLEKTATLALMYSDGYERYEDFELTLIDMEEEGLSKTFSLEKTREEQTISFVDFVDDIGMHSFRYAFSCLDKGERTIFDEGEVYFEDNSGAVSRIYGVRWDKTANYLEKTVALSLVYTDGYGRYSDFELTLTDMDNATLTKTFALDATTEEQEISLEGFVDNIYSHSFLYEFACLEDGYRNVFDSGMVHFEDNSGAVSEFYGLSWDSTANFLTGEIKLTLSYDDYDNRFSDFRFTLFSMTSSVQHVFNLEASTEEQTIDGSDLELSPSNNHFGYSLEAYDYGVDTVLTSGDVIISDNSDSFTGITGLLWDRTANWNDYTFEFGVEVIDPFDQISDVKLTLFNESDGSQEKTFDITEYGKKLTFDGSGGTSGGYLDFIHGSFTYTVTYVIGGETLTYEEGTVVFENSLEPVFNDFICDFTFSGSDNFIPMRIDQFDPMELYSSIELILETESGEIPIYLSPTSEWQYYDFTYDSTANSIDLDLLIDKSINWRLQGEYHNLRTEEFTTKVLKEGTNTFTRQSKSEVYGMILQSTEVMMTSPHLDIQPVYVDDEGYFSEFRLKIETSEDTYEFAIPDGVNYRTDYSMIDLNTTYDGKTVTEKLVEELQNPVNLYITYADSSLGGARQELLTHEDLELNLYS